MPNANLITHPLLLLSLPFLLLLPYPYFSRHFLIATRGLRPLRPLATPLSNNHGWTMASKNLGFYIALKPKTPRSPNFRFFGFCASFYRACL